MLGLLVFGKWMGIFRSGIWRAEKSTAIKLDKTLNASSLTNAGAFKSDYSRYAHHDLSDTLEFCLTIMRLRVNTQSGVHLFSPSCPSIRVLDLATTLPKPRFAVIDH